jgi:hypothetical protein
MLNREALASEAENLDCTHEVVMGLLESLETVLHGQQGCRVMALCCAMHRYMDELGEIIGKVQAMAGEGA